MSIHRYLYFGGTCVCTQYYWHGQISSYVYVYKIIVIIIIVSNEYRNIAVRIVYGLVAGGRVLRRTKYNSPHEYIIIIIIIMYKFLRPCGFEAV